MEIKQGEIYWVNLTGAINHKENPRLQKGERPCIIVSNPRNNIYSDNVHIVPLTSQAKNILPTHVLLFNRDELKHSTLALCEQVMVIDKKHLKDKVLRLTKQEIRSIYIGIQNQFWIGDE